MTTAGVIVKWDDVGNIFHHRLGQKTHVLDLDGVVVVGLAHSFQHGLKLRVARQVVDVVRVAFHVEEFFHGLGFPELPLHFV